MKNTIKLFITMTGVASAFLLLSFIYPQDQAKPKPWQIPDEYQKMKNPVSNEDAKLVKIGQMLYNKHCKSCHGSNGLGDGPMSKQLQTFPGDFSSQDFNKQTDGELYYKSYIGRDEMPNFEKKILDEEDRWAIVTYMRTMSE